MSTKKQKDEKFKVVCLADKREYIRGGETVYFSDGPSAAAVAAKLSLDWGTKWQPRRVVIDANWMAREAKRFYDGTYFPVPWDSEPWWRGSNPDLKHFAHVSIEQDAMIAFTPNAEMGTADRQKRMSPGSYLAEYCKHVLSGDGIRDWAALFEVTYEDVKVGFAKTADEIEDVYVKGPRSCMSHPTSAFQEYTKGVHPTRMYAGPDLAVAYLLSKDPQAETQQTYFCTRTCREHGCCTDSYGRPRNICPPAQESMVVRCYSARSVVWPEKRIYTRIYGDIQRLKACLERDGFHAGHIHGAKLTRQPIEALGQNGFILPYIDSVTTVRDDGNWLVANRNGYIGARNTNGLGFDNRPRCDECHELNDNIVMQDLWDAAHENVQRLCRSCYDKAGQIVREWNNRGSYTGYYLRRNHAICIEGPDYGIHIAQFDVYMAVCSKTGTLWWRSETKLMADGSRVSNEWYRANGKNCTRCHRGFPRNSGETMRCGDQYCPGQFADGVVPAEMLATRGLTSTGIDLGSGSYTITSFDTAYQQASISALQEVQVAAPQRIRVR
jgi:hypothetical protein